MVLLFLRDLRSAFIVILNIPIAIAAAVLALWIGGYTINLMTLGGLALAVGILVDEATVEIENIHRHMKQGSAGTLARIVLDASEETIGPRSLSMLCVLAVFVPSFFMTGAAKALFLPLSLAVGFSMIASYLLSSTLVPILNIWWHRSAPVAQPSRLLWQLQARGSHYCSNPSIALRHILVPAYLGGVIFAISILLPFIGTEIFPQIDAGQLQLRLRAPTATRLETTEQIALRTLAIIGEETGPDKVAISMGLVGVHAPNYPVNLIHQWNSGPEEAILQIQLKDGSGVAISRCAKNSAPASPPSSRRCSSPLSLPTSFRASWPSAHPRPSKSPSAARISPPAARMLNCSKPSSPNSKTCAMCSSARRSTIPASMSDRPRTRRPARRKDERCHPQPRGCHRQQPLHRAKLLGRHQNRRQLLSASPGAADTDERPRRPAQPARHRANKPPVPLRNIAKISEGSVIGQYDRYNMARTVSITANLHDQPLGVIAKQVEKVIAANPAPAGVSVTLRGQVPPLKNSKAACKPDCSSPS
jgi:multidrug efflux pump subunit AcrB